MRLVNCCKRLSSIFPLHPTNSTLRRGKPLHTGPYQRSSKPRMLYGRHGVADIAAARADVSNLTRTTTAIHRAIADARGDSWHMVIFVTGIPGAGKTLCGLNAVFGSDSGAAFLTGN